MTSWIIATALACVATTTTIAVLVKARRTRHVVPYTPPPRERCGALTPAFFEHSERTECVLRPGHSGSHAGEHGTRWWYTPATAEDGAVCEAYRVPATAEDSGLCARCGMFDYKHKEASGA